MALIIVATLTYQATPTGHWQLSYTTLGGSESKQIDAVDDEAINVLGTYVEQATAGESLSGVIAVSYPAGLHTGTITMVDGEVTDTTMLT